ncbi:unnamed protein product [Cylindrotheca closterium]|uniref:Uncharacterized protein n=1 Tax=Cylindrotheca closterium TaxID=2856 RepID=A0AAD2G369_9STRA|nr:unnamed protein product [Cylindrotheca closterium]
MRFGMDTAPPILMQEFCSVLSSEPWAGVFPAPIQVSDMVRLGFLPLLPQELTIGPYCKDLMHLCDFQYPIGLMQEWAKKAEDAEPTKPLTKTLDVLSDSESSGDDNDDDSPPTFEWTTIIKKSLVVSTPKPVEDKKKSLLTAPTSPEDNDAWIDQLAQMDLTNDRPSPLFIMILPAEEDGCYFVVVRQRYL